MSEKRDRDVEKVFSAGEFVAKLRRLADALEVGERVEIRVAGERVYVPARAEFNVEPEREGGEEELEFQPKWTNRQKTHVRSRRPAVVCAAPSATRRGVPLRPLVNCYCGQCRRTSGHFVAATAARREDVALTGSGGLRWHKSFRTTRRGFCQIRGASLFREAVSGRRISIMAGTLDQPTGLGTVARIFVEDASDYYEIRDGRPRHPGGDHEVQFSAL